MTSEGKNRSLDVRGLKCPLPALRTRKALRRLSSGDGLTVQATDPMAAIDIPHLVAAEGHTLLGVDRSGDCLTFRIRKA